eukprot:Hpha_TRINITY_DN31195_c0_g1::TRINITY_DN31195_c0_g1_i1::g.32951::m.32951
MTSTTTFTSSYTHSSFTDSISLTAALSITQSLSPTWSSAVSSTTTMVPTQCFCSCLTITEQPLFWILLLLVLLLCGLFSFVLYRLHQAGVDVVGIVAGQDNPQGKNPADLEEALVDNASSPAWSERPDSLSTSALNRGSLVPLRPCVSVAVSVAPLLPVSASVQTNVTWMTEWDDPVPPHRLGRPSATPSDAKAEAGRRSPFSPQRGDRTGTDGTDVDSSGVTDSTAGTGEIKASIVPGGSRGTQQSKLDPFGTRAESLAFPGPAPPTPLYPPPRGSDVSPSPRARGATTSGMSGPGWSLLRPSYSSQAVHPSVAARIAALDQAEEAAAMSTAHSLARPPPAL